MKSEFKSSPNSRPSPNRHLTSQSKINDEDDTVAHFYSLKQLSEKFGTDLEIGLSYKKVEMLSGIYGLNVLETRIDTPLWTIFRHNLFGYFPTCLWMGGFLSVVIHLLHRLVYPDDVSYENLYLGVIIFLVVIFTGFFGFYQEAKNVMVMQGFADMLPKFTRVIREGKSHLIPSENLVVGDLIVMNAGEHIPADVRLVMVNNFCIEMSNVTGETEPQSRTVEITDENPMETKNLAFSSCFISEGSAKGIVIAIGEQTVIGKIAGLVLNVQKIDAPVRYEIKHFVKTISVVGVILGIIFFVVVTIIYSSWLTGFYYMVAIIVANIPEGLLVTVTLSFSLTARKLKKKNCLTKKLEFVETLGAVTVICSDKTGTLTQNVMSVSHLYFDNIIFNHDEHMLKRKSAYKSVAFAACLCLKAEFELISPENITKSKISGDATEKAILCYMEVNYSATTVRRANPKLFEIPFSPVTKYQLSIHEMANSNDRYLVMKGAPDVIFDYCTTILLSYGEKPFTDAAKKAVVKSSNELSNMGERVIGYCDMLLPSSEYPDDYIFDARLQNYPMKGFRFLGLISLIDPPRVTVSDAIAKCRSAGIKVIMVTGDHPITALAISKKVGIITDKNDTLYDAAFRKKIDPDVYKTTVDIFDYKAAVVTGDDIKAMSSYQMDRLLKEMDEIIFARTTPQQKLLIVESCQRIGHIVAVTGDGVNDAPALKRANIGVAMGVIGTDIAKDAADMILLDDDFASIVLGIEEGRLIYDNLKKSIAFILTSNIPEMFPFVLYATLGIPLPLNALLIVIINILTDLWPAMSFAYEKAEADIMQRTPRSLDDRLVTNKLIAMTYFQIGLLQTAAGMTGYFFTFSLYGFYPSNLFFVRNDWEDSAVDDFEDSYGQEWTYQERKHLEAMVQSSYYVCLVIVQIADCIICKTRRLSIVKQGMNNNQLNLGIMAMTLLSVLIIYIPFFNTFLYTAPVPWTVWFISFPHAFVLIAVDEIRRYLIRKNPNGWVAEEFYY